MQTQSPPFDCFIKALDDLIAEITRASLTETASLLKIARIDLISRANGIPEKDLEAFFSSLEYQQRVADGTALPTSRRRRRKEPNLTHRG